MHNPDLAADSVTGSPRPTVDSQHELKPLKILTLDGGGNRGIASLMILDKLLTTIAEENNCPRPRPCDVFDVIAGIGAGGWLAILLGRFQLDTTACLIEWYKLMQSIMPRTWGEGFPRRLRRGTYFDSQKLKDQVKRLTNLHGSGEHLYTGSESASEARCKHVFVAALQADCKSERSRSPSKSRSDDTQSGDFGHDYCLFRSYPTRPNTKTRQGPRDPEHYTIASAFCVTGAAKYFFAPWQEEMAAGRVRFLDQRFPHPHNITKLAIDEMWAYYGADRPIQTVVNIGPGHPDVDDMRMLARSFSFGRGPGTGRSLFHRTRRPEHARQGSGRSKPTSSTLEQDGEEPRRLSERSGTFLTDRNVPLREKLRWDENKITVDIRAKLQAKYQDEQRRYFRLAPDQSPPGTPLNDTSQTELVMTETDSYLQNAEEMVQEVAERLSDDSSRPVAVAA